MSFQREKKLILDFYSLWKSRRVQNALEEFTQFCSENLPGGVFILLI